MSGYQIEDNTLVEVLDTLRGRVPRHNIWEKHCYPQSPRNVGPSPNWYALSSAVAVYMRNERAIGDLIDVLMEPNDTGQQEALTDDEHFRFRLIGWYAGRKHARALGMHTLFKLYDEHLMQAWAMMMLGMTDPFNALRTQIVVPGQRAADPKTGRGLIDYMWCRAAGYSDKDIETHATSGTSLVRQAQRVFKNQEDFTCMEFCGHVINDLRSDYDSLFIAYMNGNGWPGLAEKYIVRGTRGDFRFQRYVDRSYVGVLAKDFGVDNARIYVKWTPGMGISKPPMQFPSTPQPRKNTEFTGEIRDGKIYAHDSEAGSSVTQLPTSQLVFDIRINKTGVNILYPEKGVEPPPVVTDPEPKKDKRSWWERFIDKILEWVGA